MRFVEVDAGRVFDVRVGERPRAVIEVHTFGKLDNLILTVKVIGTT
jgi:hypothetical protein